MSILHAFSTKDPNILWPAFMTYVKLIIMYGASEWSPVWKSKINHVEKIKRKFTKKLSGLEHFSYIEQSNEL